MQMTFTGLQRSTLRFRLVWFFHGAIASILDIMFQIIPNMLHVERNAQKGGLSNGSSYSH